ncbi:MAG: GIY-YIG nuclease family protein [Amaricoccus sp.]
MPRGGASAKDISWDTPLPEGGSGVYLLTAPNGKVYVGWTGVGFEDRWQGHLKGARGDNDNRSKLYPAMRKYGPDAFTRVVLGVFETFEEGYDFETAEIARRDSIKNGLNWHSGGRGGHGGEEWLERHRAATSGSSEWLERATEANRRIHATPGYREKLAEAHGSPPPASDEEVEACYAELSQRRGEGLPAKTACRCARLLHQSLNNIQFGDAAVAEGFNRNVAGGAYKESYIATALYPIIRPAAWHSISDAIAAAVAELPGFIEDERAYKQVTFSGSRQYSPIAGGLRRLALRYPDLPITPLARAIAASGICSFGLAVSNIGSARQIIALAADLGVLPPRPESVSEAA